VSKRVANLVDRGPNLLEFGSEFYFCLLPQCLRFEVFTLLIPPLAFFLALLYSGEWCSLPGKLFLTFLPRLSRSISKFGQALLSLIGFYMEANSKVRCQGSGL